MRAHHARRSLAPLAVLVLLAASLPLVPAGADAANSGFVRAQGGQFVLNAAPFRFVGTNAYFMLDAVNYGSTAHTTQMLSLANDLGFTVLRTWGFMDGTGAEGGFQTGPGVYNETAARQLDWVLYQADLAGVRLVVTLVNYWPVYGGMPQYVAWCAPRSPVDVFYTSPTCKQIYKDWVRYLVTRVNTYTGRAYRDDPTIFAWELANEPNSSDATGETVRAWVSEMAAYVKSLDPNHMVGTGEEGFDTTAQGYQPLSAYNNQSWLFNGDKGVSFSRNTADPNIDFGSVHLYPEYWNFSASTGNAWIADHIRIARSLGKPLVVGEFGFSTNPLPVFDSWLSTFEAEQGAGALVWQIICPVCINHGGLDTVYPPASPVADRFKAAAQLATAAGSGSPAPPFTIGSTSAGPVPAVTGQAVTIQTSVTASAAASNVIVDLEVHDAAGQKIAQQAYSGQSFGAGQTLSYTWSWPGSQTAGAYTAVVAVFDASWSTLYTSVNPAASFTVQAPASQTFTVGATSATPSSVLPGQTVTVATSVTAGAAASGTIVDLSIWNSAGSRVVQQAYTGQGFTAGQSRGYTWPWVVPGTLPPGTYRVSVGVFDASWTTPYAWVDAAATFTVQAPLTVGFTVGATTVSPNPVSRGQSITIATAITGRAAASGIIVDVGIYNPQGQRIAQKAFTGQSFLDNQTRPYSWAWAVGMNRKAGTYRVSVGVFDASWTTPYVWVDSAATFTVR